MPDKSPGANQGSSQNRFGQMPSDEIRDEAGAMAVNPFAPVANTALPFEGTPRTNLPMEFWGAIGVAVLLLGGLTFVQPFFLR